MRLIGYTRVSTAEQAASGLGLEAQEAQIVAEAQHRGWSVVAWHSDAGASGKSLAARPGLADALAAISRGDADGLIVSKLDRLSRSVLDFATLVCRAQAEGWNLVVLDLGLDLNTPQGRFTAHVLCAAAQLERELIGQRTKDALAAARARGIRPGFASRVPENVAARIRAEREAGDTLSVIADRLNADGIPTATGSGRWHRTSVRAVILRAA